MISAVGKSANLKKGSLNGEGILPSTSCESNIKEKIARERNHLH